MRTIETRATVKELVHVTAHNHHYINPYFGCSEGCPFCCWEELPGWSGKIDVRVNAPELFEKYIENWDPNKVIYIGSCCNSYESLEAKYRLTRRILSMLKDRGIRFLLTTSTKLILDDMELFVAMKEQAIVVMELCRIKRIKTFNLTGYHEGIEAGNLLRQNGVTVWATLGPILPGITDIQKVLDALNDEIPLYVSPLDVSPMTAMRRRLLDAIQREYPELVLRYDEMIAQKKCEEVFEKEIHPFLENPRIYRMPFPI